MKRVKDEPIHKPSQTPKPGSGRLIADEYLLHRGDGGQIYAELLGVKSKSGESGQSWWGWRLPRGPNDPDNLTYIVLAQKMGGNGEAYDSDEGEFMCWVAMGLTHDASDSELFETDLTEIQEVELERLKAMQVAERDRATGRPSSTRQAAVVKWLFNKRPDLQPDDYTPEEVEIDSDWARQMRAFAEEAAREA